MLQSLLRDLKRCFTSLLFWLCVTACMASVVISLTANLYFFPEAFRTAGALTMFLHGTALSFGGSFELLAPLIATLPFSLAYIQDLSSGNIQYNITRQAPRRYFTARYISTALSGGLVYVLSYSFLLALALLLSRIPAYRIYLDPMTAFRYTYDRSLLAYTLLYTLHSFVFGCSYALLALGISALFQNQLLALIAPVSLYHSGVLLAWMFPKIIVYDIVKYIPYNTLSVMSKHSLQIWLDHISVIFLATLLYIAGIIRYRKRSFVLQ